MALSPFSFVFDTKNYGENNFFARALWLARFAMGNTHPNPSVGAVLVKDGKIVAEGFTEPAGGMHAEKMAIHRARGQSAGATLYVTLEPCAHFGRTPPCTDAIIKANIAEVIYGVGDPNPLVFGKGIAQLQAASIAVRMVADVCLKDAALAHLKPFTRNICDHKPYVVLKVAASADGNVAYDQRAAKITGTASDLAVHQLRRAVDAVMVGARTARIDNPQLTPRMGEAMHDTLPIRLVLSADLKLDPTFALFNTAQARTWVLTKAGTNPPMRARLEARGVTLIDCPVDCEHLIDLKEALKLLADRGLTSILVEAGPRLRKNVMENALADELWWLEAPILLGSSALPAGISPEQFSAYGYEQSASQKLGLDTLQIWHKR